MVNLVVLYPHPQDTEKFEADYVAHLQMLHQKLGIPHDIKPYVVTRFLNNGADKAAFYQMFSMPFGSAEALNNTLSTPEMQEVAGDAHRISTGGPPVIMAGRAG